MKAVAQLLNEMRSSGVIMSEIQALLERQARWQKTRRALSWPEKVRMEERVLESVRQLRRPRKAEPDNPERTPP
jgi:hypothetical protein